MQMLSEDDLDLRAMTQEELESAWDLWFDLAQETNDADPPYTHGVFQLCRAAMATAPPHSPGSSTTSSGSNPTAGSDG